MLIATHIVLIATHCVDCDTHCVDCDTCRGGRGRGRGGRGRGADAGLSQRAAEKLAMEEEVVQVQVGSCVRVCVCA